MSKQLSAEWQQKIEDEALELTKRFKDNNDYQAGYIQGFQDGYSKGAVVYGTQLIEAQERVERVEKLEQALKRIQRYCFGSNNTFLNDIKGYADEAISPDNKLKEDE